MRFLRDNAFPLFLSVLVHAAVLALVVYGFLIFRPQSKPQPAPQLAIEAEVVDEARIREEMQRLEREEQAQARRQREEEQRAAELKREREAEEQRLEELRRQRAAEEEAERQKAEQRQREEEERATRAAEQEAKRKTEQAKAAAAEKKRKEEEARRKAEEARQRAAREAELKRQLAEEERRATAVDAGLLAQYVARIQARVQRAWIRPPGARAGLNCVVYVTQVPGGEVVSVRVGECNGDEIVRQSIEAAVYRASPLPEPPDPALFERNLKLTFKPDE